MLNQRYILLALPLALTFGGFLPSGCAANDSEQQDELVEVVDPMTTHSSFYGTWIAEARLGRFQSLALLTDHRYHAERSVVCIKAPCNPIPEDGTFTLYTRDEHNIIEFTSNTTGVATVEYIYRNGTLYLREFRDGAQWYFMKRASAAWCAKFTDCQLQNLPTGICSGDYVCREEGTCGWRCANTEQNSIVDR